MRIRKCREHNGWRWWINFGDYAKRGDTVRIEFYPGRRELGCTLSMRAQGESTISLMLKIPFLFSLYVTWDTMWGYSTKWSKFLCLDDDRRYDGREFGFSWYGADGCISGGSINFYLGSHLNGWSSKDPKWLRTHIYPQEILCGKDTVKMEDLETTEHSVTIPGNSTYPEKTYTVKCKEFRTTWTWPRFKKPLIINRFEVECEEGVPHPGKGTCDYNCDESRLYSQCAPADSREHAVQKFIDSCAWYRKNYPM